LPLRLERSGNPITSVDEWFQYAPPMGRELQWRDGRSAKELAKAWCRDGAPPSPPSDLLTLLATIPQLSHLHFLLGYPERRVHFDNAPGEPRNTDLALLCDGPGGRVAISIDAKADESFGRALGDEIVVAASQWAFSERAAKLKRLQFLVATLLSSRRDGQARLSELRYQLLTAIAGAWAFAAENDAPVAVFVVHEFLPTDPDLARVRENERDLDQALTRITANQVTSLRPGQLLGPLLVPSNPAWPGVHHWYVGKCRTTL
jgi:hypothetical protein